MARLQLLRGEVALLDDEDLAKVTELSKGKHNWYLSTVGYPVILAGRGKTIYLHRLIMGAPKGKQVDHINGDKLDNRKSNLRICDQKQNVRNKRVVKSKSGHLGVYWSNQNKKWNAQIGLDGKSTSLGFFDDINDAIKARQKAEKAYFGEFAPSWSR